MSCSAVCQRPTASASVVGFELAEKVLRRDDVEHTRILPKNAYWSGSPLPGSLYKVYSLVTPWIVYASADYVFVVGVAMIRTS